MSNNFLLELVSKLPKNAHEAGGLRKRMTRKTGECLGEILGFVARTEGRIRVEESDPNAVPARLSFVESMHVGPVKPLRGGGANELRKDDSVRDLEILISSISISVDEDASRKKGSSKKKKARLAAPGIFDLSLVSMDQGVEETKPAFLAKTGESLEFESPLDFLRDLYPGIEIEPPKKLGLRINLKEENGSQNQLVEETIDTLDFIGINDKKTKIVEDVEDQDIFEKMHSSSLPESLKDKFRVDLLKKKKKETSEKVVEQKKKHKTNETDLKSKEMFTRGNVFDVLKSREADAVSEEEDPGEGHDRNAFWDTYKRIAEEKASQAAKPVGKNAPQAPKVGEIGGGWSGKSQKKPDKKKRGVFSQPSVRNVVKFN